MQQPGVPSRTPISSAWGSSTRLSLSADIKQNRNGCLKKCTHNNNNHHPVKLKALEIRSNITGKIMAHDIQKRFKSIDSSSKEDAMLFKPIENFIERRNVNGGDKSLKQKLGHRWREYQGSNNWEGLLDPLDENLRREIVKYGEFVQAAYSAFEFDARSENYGRCKYSNAALLHKVGFGSSGYRVTERIHATSSIHLPRWLARRFDGNLIWKITSFVGFVAVCADQREISRLGRRDIVVAFRGTATPMEWAENLKVVLTPIDNNVTRNIHGGCQPKVENGFWSLFTTKGRHGRSACDQVIEEVRRLVDLYKDENVSITVTGHSLGAALSLLTALRIGEEFAVRERSIPLTVFSFGGPRVGNRAFGRRLEEVGAKVLRVVNAHDVVTKVPGVVLNEAWMQVIKQRCQNLREIVAFLEKMPWAYSHVGTELGVNNRHSPYLKPDADMSCCHDLEVYLHLVDGFLSSATPFRSTAKRDLLRLLINQKSNILLKPSTRMGNLDKEIGWN